MSKFQRGFIDDLEADRSARRQDWGGEKMAANQQRTGCGTGCMVIIVGVAIGFGIGAVGLAGVISLWVVRSAPEVEKPGSEKPAIPTSPQESVDSLGSEQPTSKDEPKAAAKAGSQAKPRTSAVVILAKLVPFENPSVPRKLQMVMTTWKNTGTTPIRVIDATFKFRVKGRQEPLGVDYTLYAESDASPGVLPGRTFTTAKGEGFIFPEPLYQAESVEVVFNRVLEKSGM